MQNHQLLLDPGKITRALSLLALVLVIASSASLALNGFAGHALTRKLMKFFYVDLELNAPAFFSTMMLLTAAVLLMLVVYFKRSLGQQAAPWAVLAVGFVIMAFDEIVSVHERLIEPMREVLGGQD